MAGFSYWYFTDQKAEPRRKQKIAMARAIIHAPDFIIADEPTGNLDEESSLQIADIL